jgi:hypothetical protein
MTDAPNHPAQPLDPAALADWAHRLGVTTEQLQRAIAAAGNDPVAVEAYIQSGHNEAG